MSFDVLETERKLIYIIYMNHNGHFEIFRISASDF